MSRVPYNNIIDDKLDELIDRGLLPPYFGKTDTAFSDGTTCKVHNIYSDEYWKNAVDLLDVDDCEYIISFKQQNNWNSLLYEHAKVKVLSYIDKLLLE